ncbi:MAG: multicopper oxidase family protein [Segniliparus sp.]|uniref:multicopper oxidase family protein n=1 Tax=Segniliparus sp. TaxID=2804064 RepID=UPI003F30BAF2
MLSPSRKPMTRRDFVSTVSGGLAALAVASTAACGKPAPASGLAEAIAKAERTRPHTGRVVAANLVAGPAQVDLGGLAVDTLAYSGGLPGPLLRANAGDEITVTLANRLDHATSIHWHGLALRNDMDGAASATADIAPGQTFTYRFSAPNPGTYWAHPHTGVDADYGLYFPVVIDDPAEPGAYDAEWIVVLDDWTDGVGKSPKQVWEDLRMMAMPDMPGMDMSHMDMPGMGGMRSDLLGGDAGDVAYPYYLVNGRIPAAPSTFSAKSGQRVRIRLVNAGSDTAFRVALAGHRMTVTHTDGFPVRPVEVDALLLGMGERYDVVVTAQDGVFPLVAAAEGKQAQGNPALARAVLTTGAGSAPAADFRPPELDRQIGTVEQFTAAEAVQLPAAKPDTTLSVDLSGSMMKYDWAINGARYPDMRSLKVRQGQHATLVFDNQTTMWHPMHLHGHTFQVIRQDGSPGPRKDTVVVLPGQKLSARLVADNPGDWMLHCHNTYHQEAGMMTRLDYEV